MIAEPFAEGSTLLHRRDARVKLISATLITLALALTSSFLVAGTGCILAGILLALSRPGPRLVMKRIGSVNLFTLFLWFTLPFSYGGDRVLSFFFLDLSLDGIRTAALITLKTNTILFSFLALLATSTVASLGHGLEQLGMPRKLTFLLLFTYRQLFVIHQEYQRLHRAARLRGFVPANSLHTYRTYSHLFGMTLVKSWNRSQRVHQAMVLRGFAGRLIPLTPPSPCTADLLFLCAMLTITLLLTGIPFFC